MSIRTRGGLVAACLCLTSAPVFATPESSHTGSCGPSIQAGGESAATSTFVPGESASAPAPAAPTEVAMAPSASSSVVEEAPAPAEPAAAPAPAKPAAAPAPKPAKTKAWWPSRSDGKLNIVDVRSGEFSKTIVIQTDGKFQSVDAAATAIQVSSTDGQAVEPKWSLAANKQTLILPVPAGKYTVKIGTQLADAAGKAVAKDSSGTVEVP